MNRIPSNRPEPCPLEGPDLSLARLLLISVYEETTAGAADLRHCARGLVDACRSRSDRARRAREQLARLEREIERARRCGRLDDRGACRLNDYLAQVDPPRCAHEAAANARP